MFVSTELTFLAEWWGGIDIQLYGAKEDYDKLGTESSMCLANHRSDVDWLIGWIMADRAGILGVRNISGSQTEFKFFRIQNPTIL